MQQTLVWMSTVGTNVNCLSFLDASYNMQGSPCPVVMVGGKRETQWSQWSCFSLWDDMGFADWLESLFSVHKVSPTVFLYQHFLCVFHVGLHRQLFQIIGYCWRTSWSSLLSKTHYTLHNYKYHSSRPDKLSQYQVHSRLHHEKRNMK